MQKASAGLLLEAVLVSVGSVIQVVLDPVFHAAQGNASCWVVVEGVKRVQETSGSM